MTMAGPDGHWTASAKCGTGKVAPDALFVEGAAQRDARAVCGGCAVRLLCLADALDSRADFGVWGGMTEREPTRPAAPTPRGGVLVRRAAGPGRRAAGRRRRHLRAPR